MTSSFNEYLLIFNRSTLQLEEIREFGTDTDAAVVAYGEAENEFRGDPHIEVVLIGSDSLDTIRVTHGVYFEAEAISERFMAKVSELIDSR